ncbi:MAG: alpha/beta fold hydrolase [Rhodobacterales bacterium]
MIWMRIWRANSDMPLECRGGFPTHWIKTGSGPHEALLIHCSLGHAGGWARMVASLDDLVTAIAYDLPGHGRSADWDARDDIQAVSMAMAVDLLEDQMQGRAVDVIGHSFGGTVALRLAVERPDLVRSLVLIEPVFFAAAVADRPDLPVRDSAHMIRYRDALQAGDRIAAAQAFTSVWGDGRAWNRLPEAQQKAMAARIHLIEAGSPAIYDDASGILSSGALGRITVPVLLIKGEDSPDMISVINDGLARRIPDTAQIAVPGAGHMAPITHPDAVAAAVRAFLGRIAPDQSA